MTASQRHKFSCDVTLYGSERACNCGLPQPICEWCGMEVDPEDGFNNTETPNGWLHDSCLDEQQIAEEDSN